MRKYLSLLGLILLMGCSPSTPEPAAAQPEAHQLEREFAKGQEARAWMATGRNHMLEASDETTNQVIQELYAQGAEEVRVTDASPMTESSGELAATLVAKLPSDEAKRAALFAFEKKSSEDVDPDQKRDYIEVVFD